MASLQHVNDFCSKMNLINNEKQLEQSPVCTGRGVVGLICHFIASYVAFLSSSHNKLAQPQEKKKTKNKTKNCLFTNSTVYGFENKITSFKEFSEKQRKIMFSSKMFFFSSPKPYFFLLKN